MVLARGETPRAGGATALTVSDLVVLVVGVALALAILPWDLDGDESSGLVPTWLMALSSVERAVRTASLALVPLAAWRRVRIGGVCRPAELLLVVCAAPGVVARVDEWILTAADWNLDDGYGARYWLCHGAAWSLCAAAILGLIIARRRLSGAARSALLMLAVATSFAWIPEPEYINTLPAHYHRAGYAEDTACVIAGALKFFVPSVVGAAAIRDMMRRRSSAGVMGWVGLVLAVCNLAVAPPLHLWGAFLLSPPPVHDVHLHIIYFGGPILAGTLGATLVWMWGRLWAGVGRSREPHPQPPRNDEGTMSVRLEGTMRER
jgi:hypothetical protein